MLGPTIGITDYEKNKIPSLNPHFLGLNVDRAYHRDYFLGGSPTHAELQSRGPRRGPKPCIKTNATCTP